jgi:hypothetical protein
MLATCIKWISSKYFTCNDIYFTQEPAENLFIPGFSEESPSKKMSAFKMSGEKSI